MNSSFVKNNPLSGRHAVVTGGSRGIGLAIAEELARLGADITIMGRDAARLQNNVEHLLSRGAMKAAAVAVDVTEAASIERAFSKAAEQFGPPGILINNAGLAFAAPTLRTTLEDWNRVLMTDLTGPFLCTQQVLKSMVKTGFGRIVNVASTAGLTGYGYVSAYCAAKHGLIGFTRALAKEVAKSGVTANAVCPGYTNTDIVGTAISNIVSKTGRTRDEALAELTAHNPQGRLIEPREVAQAVGWLCLPDAISVTGQSIVVAGGELM